MNVLSLFDGMSCGRIALERAGIEINNYYASEIDKYAIKVSSHNYPDIIQLGDVRNYKEWELPEIDLLIAGSPCQDLSRIKTDGKGLHGDKSKLFFEFVKCLKKFKPRYFLLENVLMDKESEDVITSILEVEPTEINSSYFSAQERRRLYWTNIELDKELPENNSVLKDIIENEVDEKYYYNDVYYGLDHSKRVVCNLERRYPNGKMKFTETLARVYNINHKSPTLTAVAGGHQEKKIFHNGRPRKLTPLEYERLQMVPDGYTSVVSDSQRYKMLGNGWTIDVIAHIFRNL